MGVRIRVPRKYVNRNLSIITKTAIKCQRASRGEASEAVAHRAAKSGYELQREKNCYEPQGEKISIRVISRPKSQKPFILKPNHKSEIDSSVVSL